MDIQKHEDTRRDSIKQQGPDAKDRAADRLQDLQMRSVSPVPKGPKLIYQASQTNQHKTNNPFSDLSFVHSSIRLTWRKSESKLPYVHILCYTISLAAADAHFLAKNEVSERIPFLSTFSSFF